MKKHIVAAVFMLFPTVAAVAGSGDDAMPFVRIPRDPVALGMGGAGAVSGSAYSTFTNMAALPFADFKFDVAADYQKWEPTRTDNFTVGAGWNVTGKLALGVGFNYGGGEKYNVYDDTGKAGGTFTPSEMQVNIGAAWKCLDFLSVGANVKYLRNTPADGYSYNAVAVDAFVMAKLSDFKVTAGVSSVGSKVEDDAGESYSLPASVTLGGGYDHLFGKKHGVDVLVDLDCYFSGNFTVAAGAQYTFNDIVSVRGGYHYGGDSVIPDFGSVGAGVKFAGVRINFAYLIASGDSALKNTFCVGAGFSF